ncbi:MAG: heavy-metal-associated domain-containing protein [Brucellaceae bacterium]|nr:heavy-metal-associated domain-containing protein [Brucellaceae bacterium]
MDITLPIEGMHCGGCVSSVEKALSAVPGVTSVAVSLEKATAEVKADDTVSHAALAEAVEDAGFDVAG